VESRDDRKGLESVVRKCPHCTQEIPDEAEICPYCQPDVAPPQTAADTAPMIKVHRPLKTVIKVLFVAIFVLYKWHNYAQRDQEVQSYSQKVKAYHQNVEAYYQQAGAWNAKCLAFVGTSLANPIAKQCHEELAAIVAKANADGLHIDVTKVEAYNQEIEAWYATCLAFGTSSSNPIPKQCEDQRNALVARAKPDGWLIDKR